MEEEFSKAFIDQVEFYQEFFEESERAAVIVGAAKIDEMLEKLISKVLSDKREKKDELFATEKPLCTFSSKISMAYRLGLIDLQLQRELDLLRKIRNAFSHNVVGCKLSEKPHSDRVKEIHQSCSNDPMYKQLHGIFPSKFSATDEVAQMKSCIVYMAAILSALQYWAKPVCEINAKYIRNNRII